MGPVKAVAAGVVGKARRSAGSRRPVVPVAELYANGSGVRVGVGGGEIVTGMIMVGVIRVVVGSVRLRWWMSINMIIILENL